VLEGEGQTHRGDCRTGTVESGEAGAFDLLAEVDAVHLDHDAHLLQTGLHAVGDAVAEGGGLHGAGGIALGAGEDVELVGGGFAVVGVVGGDDGGAAVVVAGVEDVLDGVPDPVGGFGGTEFIEDEDFGVEDGGEDLTLGEIVAAVGVLDLLEEIAVVVEEAFGAAVGDEGLEDADGEMGLADADVAGEEETFAVSLIGVGFDEGTGLDEGGGKGGVAAVPGGFEVIEGAVLVAAGDAGLLEEAGGAAGDAAVAGLGDAGAVGARDDAETGVVAEGAGVGHGV
jgi:hypothetical protein